MKIRLLLFLSLSCLCLAQPCRTDFGMDCLAVMAEDWLCTDHKSMADFDGDGVVDLKDFAILARIWAGDVE